MVQIEGNYLINELDLQAMDGLEIFEEEIFIRAKETSHFLIIEIKKKAKRYINSLRLISTMKTILHNMYLR